MYRLYLLYTLLLFSFFSLSAQNSDTTEVSITNFQLAPGTYSWRFDNSYEDMTSWDSSPYTEGNLQQRSGPNWAFRQNFRLLYPKGYDPDYSPGYPIIVMFHGAGERGNCWDNACYCPDCTAYPLPDNSVREATNVQYLNNDHNLSHGGAAHLAAVNLADTKKPDDPSLNARAFPGFVFFPQNYNGWSSGDINNALRTLRLLMKQLNIDENRVYIHGLSNGGQGVYSALVKANWLFAAAATMSGLTSNTYRQNVDKVATVPTWFFQGGQDGNPTQAATESTVRTLQAGGGNARYTLYPSLGHGTWVTAYNEPDFFSWLLSHNKSNIHVYYGSPFICGITGEGSKLGLSAGFFAYQWERDGVIIPDATEHIYMATVPGVYRARFSRISSTPAEHEWNRWSDPVNVTEIMPAQAKIDVTGSTHLRGPNPNSQGNTIILKSNTAHEKYYWYRDGALDNIPSNNIDDTVRTYTITSNRPDLDNGMYTLRVSGFDNCLSPESKPVYLYFNNSASILLDENMPGNFEGRAISESSILLTWTDQSRIEKGYEIWRKKTGGTFDFVKLTNQDDISFLDTNLESATTYEYKIRAINNTGRTNYRPSNNDNINLSVTTFGDDNAPAAPQNLTASSTGFGLISLQWTASADTDIAQYYIYFGSDSIGTGSAQTTYTFSDLPLNKIFRYTVKSVDFGGNFSPSSNQAVASTYSSGLFYKHSTGAWSSLTQPEILPTWTNPEFTGTVANFTLAPRTQDDFFNFEFSGFIYINTGGDYRFRTTSDDGSNLTLNGNLIVNNDGLHGNETVTSSSIPLTAGPQTINVKYFENGGGQSLTVQYRGPDTNDNWLTIPASALKSGTPPPAATPPAAPTNLTAEGVSMTQIDLAWQHNGTSPDGLDIVVLGSSTAKGEVGPTPGNGWVNLLTNWINITSTGSTVTNLAQGGFNTNDVLPNGNANYNITKALSLNPDIIIVNLPTNDVADDIPLETTMSNFSAIKALADAEGVTMFITTSQPRNNGVGGLPGRLLLQQTAVEIRETFGAYVIDIYDELTDFTNNQAIKEIYHSGDNIHLNDAGHAYIFETTKSKLIPYLTSFEVHRGESASGTFTMISNTSSLNFQDQDLLPGTTYYYKLKTSNINGTSAFTPTVSATTLGDDEAPTQPTGLTALTSTYSNVSLIWTQSTDNVNVIGYEVWGNGMLLGTSSIPGYQVSELTPETSYEFYVIAYDVAGNKSVPSASVTTSTSNPDIYYSKSSGSLTELSTWGNNNDGSGAEPSGFDINGQYFVVHDRDASVVNNWSVEGSHSKVIVEGGSILTLDNPMNSRVDVLDSSVLNLNHASAPTLSNLAATSTVNYNAATNIQQTTYGNLGLSGGAKTFNAGATTVLGNITAGNGVALKGATGNQSRVVLSGNLTFSETPGLIAKDFGISLELVGNGDQTISTEGNLDLHQIKKTGSGNVALQNGDAPVTLNIGGGGISINAGSSFLIDNNNLTLTGSGINADGETGTLSISKGDISITSSSSANSNLYFDPAQDTLKRFTVNLTGSGKAFFHSPAKISEGLKIRSGSVESNGNITLLSNATRTANLEEIENNGGVEGDVTVQRYFKPKSKMYRYISSPVEGVTIDNWQDFFPITGKFIGASKGPGLKTNPSLFYWVEPTGYAAFPAPTGSNLDEIVRGRGYAAFVRPTTAFTMKTTGNPYQGNVPLEVVGKSTEDNGWNLVGNPYASTIAWTNTEGDWIKTDINSIIAVRDNLNSSTGQFQYYDANTGTGALTGGKIAPGQAFWVQGTTASAALTVTEKAKRADQQEFYREGTPEVSHLKITLDKDTQSDPTYIAFTNYGTDNFDRALDGLKRANEGIFEFSSLTTDQFAMAINNMSDSYCAKEIGLNLQKVEPGTYSLSFPDVSTLIGVDKIILTDRFTGKTIDVGQQSQYTFAVTSDALTYGADRFSISLTRPALDLSLTASAPDVCGNVATVSIRDSQRGAEYVVIGDSNEILSSTVVGDGKEITLTVPARMLKEGLNQFNIRTGFKGCNSEVLATPVTFRYTPLPEVITEDVQVCTGSKAILQVSGAPENGSYNWYTADLTKIKDASGSQLEIEVVQEEESYYYVASVANGCEGPKQIISVTPFTLEAPAIFTQGDTLFTHQTYGALQWFRDGEPLNHTGHFYIPETSGSYTVSLTVNACSAISEAVERNITGSETGTNSGFNVTVFPNPAPEHNLNVRISSSSQSPVRLEIMDLLGRVMYTETIVDPNAMANGFKLNPDVELQSGIYFIIVKQGKWTKKLKIIIAE